MQLRLGGVSARGGCPPPLHVRCCHGRAASSADSARVASSAASTVSAASAAGQDQGQGQESESSRIATEQEAQSRFFQACSRAMTILYCRDHGTGNLKRFMRKLSIDVNFDFRRWRKHQRASRNVTLWTPKNIFMSDNIRRLLFPDLTSIGATSGLLCFYNVYLAAPAEEVVWTVKAGFNTCTHPAMWALPLECFTVTSMALGLLITFKTQNAFSRFIEGRDLWGSLINDSRAVTSRILARVPGPNAPEAGIAEVRAAQERAVKLVRSFPLTLKYHLTEDGCNPHIEIGEGTPEADVKAATAFALRVELYGIWDMEDEAQRRIVERLLATDVANRPLHVLHELGHINATVFCHPGRGALDSVAGTEIDRSLTTFQNVLGACEKILRTPIYTPYTKFSSRFLYAWCHALPFAIFPVVGPVGTLPVSLTISYFMLGIEDIGSRVEQPFDVLPIWQYCQTIDQSCLQLVKHEKALADLDEEDDEDGDNGEFDYASNDERLKSYVDPI